MISSTTKCQLVFVASVLVVFPQSCILHLCWLNKNLVSMVTTSLVCRERGGLWELHNSALICSLSKSCKHSFIIGLLALTLFRVVGEVLTQRPTDRTHFIPDWLAENINIRCGVSVIFAPVQVLLWIFEWRWEPVWSNGIKITVLFEI